ncbi:histidine kinase [Bacillus manliponensis]|uniref:histidine kinase n=1 Tax=Bacillus manliponensis TaxID=574376 RepID=A0A073JYC6_9BACI|nr:ATP-binding protein [Bacillus manliponensis]KEK19286.1 histidine kinase [Bacillus manliponensis]
MNKDHILIQQEMKALKFSLKLFYSIYFFYEFLSLYVLPKMRLINTPMGIPDDGLGIWLYILVILLLVIGLGVQKDYPYAVKYVIFIGYIVIDFINLILMYYGTDKRFISGNIVEIFLIFFAPLFVNRYYFWWITGGVLMKYIIIGLVLKTNVVMVPVALCSIFAFICWVILVRVQDYINALETVHTQIKQTEKLAIIGRMATAIGHEIRNPLTALKGFTKLQAEKHPEDRTYYDIMTQEIERMNEIVSELMLFGRPKSKEYQLHSIEEIILYVTRIVEQATSGQKVTLKVEFDKSLPKVYCDERQMKQVFLNLLRNAIEAMPAGGDIVISGVVSKDMMNIRVKDTGCGIVESEIPKIGEAFYTTKESGTGLGLMVTYKIIEEHEGTIQFMSNVGEGTTVELSLPIQ